MSIKKFFSKLNTIALEICEWGVFLGVIALMLAAITFSAGYFCFKVEQYQENNPVNGSNPVNESIIAEDSIVDGELLFYSKRFNITAIKSEDVICYVVDANTNVGISCLPRD